MKYLGIFVIVLCAALGFANGTTDEVRNAFSLSFSLFQAFTDVYNVQIGYPMVNKYGSICQTPPYTYAHLPIGAIMDITGTLRNSTGHVIGLWYSPKNCYVKPHSQTDECVEFNFSNRVSECENDSRLQLNAANRGFSLIKSLNEVRDNIDVFSTKVGQMSVLVEHLGILADTVKQAAFIEEILERDALLEVNFGAYLELIVAHLNNDVPTLLDFIQNLNVTDVTIEKEYFRNISDTYNIVKDIQNLGKYTDTQFSELQGSIIDNFASVILSYNDFLGRLRVQQISTVMKRVALARTRLLMKHVSYSANLLTTSGLVIRTKRMKLWSQKCTVPSCGIYRNNLSLRIDALASVLKRIDLRLVNYLCDACLSSYIQEAVTFMNEWAPTTPTFVQDNLPFAWHKCIHSQDLLLRREFHLDFSRVSQSLTLTGEVNSAEGHSGTSFLPRTIFSRSEIVNGKPVRVLDMAQYFKHPLRESNEMQVEWIHLPPPVPNSIPPASGSTRFQCPPGRYGQDCQPSPIGTWSNDGYLHICSNGPEGLANYFMIQWPTPNCPFKCKNELYRVNNTCTKPQIGHYPIDGAEQLGQCRTEYDSRFISFITPGKLAMPFSCGITVNHGLEMHYNLSRVLENSFTMNLWVQLDLSLMANLLANSNNVAFGILDIPNVWSWFLVVNQSMWATLRVNADGSDSVMSSEFLIDGNWHQYTLIYDAKLRLISFIKDSFLIGTAWFSLLTKKREPDLLIIGGVHKDDETMNPSRYRVLRGSIAIISIHNVAFSLEALTADVHSVERSCSDPQKIWSNHKCNTLCAIGSYIESGSSCSCYWGKYWSPESRECIWCSGLTVGSRYPYTNITDCICQSRYVWNDSKAQCVLGLPPLIAPNVTFVYPPLPLSESSSLVSEIPVNSTVVVQYFDHSTTKNEGLFTEDRDMITLTISIVSGIDVLMNCQIPFDQLPFSFIFESTGHYRIDAEFNKPGHLPGTKYSTVIRVKQQVKEPFVSPLNRELTGKTLLRMATIETIENRIYYSLDDSPIQVFDSQKPPTILPPAILKFFAKSMVPGVLPSREQIVYFVWNTSSTGYAQYIAHHNANQIPTSNYTEDSTPNVIEAVSWCQKNAPNCILVIVMPMIGITLVVILIIFPAIVVKVIVEKKKKKRRKSKQLWKQVCKNGLIPPPPSELL